MKKPSYALITKILLIAAIVVTLGTAGWGLLLSFGAPLSIETKEETKEEVAVAKVQLSKHLGAGKTLSQVLGLNSEFDVTFDTSYVKLNVDCLARSRTKNYGYDEDYKANEGINNPFSPRAIVGPDNPVCSPR